MQFNNQFFNDLARSPGVVRAVTEAAEDIAQNAIDGAPEDSGDYKRGIHVETKYQQRFVALVVASDPKSMIIESRTGNLVRALQKKARSHRG